MTIAQNERFYEQDPKKYDISKNKEFLNWLKESIKNGYHSFIDIECLQELIDNIVYWYETKYPERELPEEAMVTRYGPSPTGSVHLGNLLSAFADMV